MDEDAKSSIASIDVIAGTAQTAWLSLLGVLAFITVTLLSITHAEVLLDSQMVELPLVRIEVPTMQFLVLGAVITTVLYGNLHLYLIKLWQAFQFAPSDAKIHRLHLQAAGKAEGESVWSQRKLADVIKPWIINDYALSLKENCAPRDHRRSWWRCPIVWVIIWWAAPAVIAWMWCKTLLARDFGASAVILICFIVTCSAGALSWHDAHGRLKLIAREADFHDWAGKRFASHAEHLQARRRLDRWRFAFAATSLTLIAIAGYVLTAQATGGPVPVRLAAALPSFERNLVVDRENLAGVPPSWESVTVQREAFRTIWCGTRGVETSVCGNVPADTPGKTNILIMQRRTYCKNELGKQGVAGNRQCARFFDGLDHDFDAAWAAAQKERLRLLEPVDLSGRDLAGASAHLANLTAARLERADLSDARLPEAVLEGAQLIGADLSSAEAYYSQLRFADLTRARLDQANFASADLEGALLPGALLRGTRLYNANLVAADLRGADLRGADLQKAKLYRANLTGALLDGADLRDAVGLTQEQLDQAVGSPETKFTYPRRIIESQIPIDRPYKVWDCWGTAPAELEELLGNPYLAEADRAALSARVCPAGVTPGATGTTEPPGEPGMAGPVSEAPMRVTDTRVDLR